jgi:predicted branched-subunit amino acid permease
MAKASGSVVSLSLGIGLATGLYGISFGALAITAGLNIWQAMLLSLLMFSGGSQFAFIGVLATGGSAALGAAIASAWLLGVRNGFYAVRMAPILAKVGLKKLIPAMITIDESTLVSISQDALPAQRKGFWLTGGFVYLFWNLATLLGAFLGSSIGDVSKFGLDAAAAAAFVALIWSRLDTRSARLVALVAIVLAVALTPVLPAGIPVLVAGLSAVFIGWFGPKAAPLADSTETEVSE